MWQEVAAVLTQGSCFTHEKETRVFCSQCPPPPLKHWQSQQLMVRASSAQGDQRHCCWSIPASGQLRWRPQARPASTAGTLAQHQPFTAPALPQHLPWTSPKMHHQMGLTLPIPPAPIPPAPNTPVPFKKGKSVDLS